MASTAFKTLKKSANSLERLAAEVDKITNPVSEKKVDDRFWKPERDKAGNGMAVIRFLPTAEADGDNLPWVRKWDHGFQGPTGKWFIENSLTTLGKDVKDPVSEYNSALWGDGSIKDKTYRAKERDQARTQKRRLSYYSNILVVSDPKHPENEGKVFLFKYGKKIFDKINMAMNPEFEGDARLNPFDIWKGANFKLRIRLADGYPNYDQSVFDTPAPIPGSDDVLEALYETEYPLQPIVAPDQFKTYNELLQRLDEVLGINTQAYIKRQKSGEPEVQAKPVFEKTDKPKATAEDSVPFDADDNDDSDDELSRFRALAE